MDGLVFIIFTIIVVVSILGLLQWFSPLSKSERSEHDVANRLQHDSIIKDGGKVLSNLYIPKPSGETTEVDVLYITSKGLIVIEDKNYAGYIFGNEKYRNWTVTLYAGKTWFGIKRVEKHKFYNPIWQNNTHISYLRKYLKSNIKAFSLITFSNRSELKSVTYSSPNVYVCHHSKISSVLKDIWNDNPDVLTNEQIEKIYDKLRPLTNADEETRQKHITDIHERLNNTEICPVCGGRLVVRTARKGSYAGSQFYGCSNYPKCTYTKKL